MHARALACCFGDMDIKMDNFYFFVYSGGRFVSMSISASLSFDLGINVIVRVIRLGDIYTDIGIHIIHPFIIFSL